MCILTSLYLLDLFILLHLIMVSGRHRNVDLIPLVRISNFAEMLVVVVGQFFARFATPNYENIGENIEK